jgi:peptide/nickel transport system permease protein
VSELVDMTGEIAIPKPKRGLNVIAILRFMRRVPIIPIFLLSLVTVAGILAPWIAPENPRRGDLRARHQPPAWLGDRIIKTGVGDETRHLGATEHILGTDNLGRDMLSRIIHGARVSLILAAATLLTGGTLGVLLGLLAGWYGGWIDESIMRLVDVALAIPLVLVALVMVVALGDVFPDWLGGQKGLIVVVLASWIWVRFARIVRGEVLQLRTRDYVALAKVAGASTPRILYFHIFPGVINTLIVVATLQVGFVILVESTLSFLGAGVPPPTPAWGSMVAEGRNFLAGSWWIATMPGVAIMFTVLSLNLFGDWLRDTLDPKLRQLA